MSFTDGIKNRKIYILIIFLYIIWDIINKYNNGDVKWKPKQSQGSGETQ